MQINFLNATKLNIGYFSNKSFIFLCLQNCRNFNKNVFKELTSYYQGKLQHTKNTKLIKLAINNKAFY